MLQNLLILFLRCETDLVNLIPVGRGSSDQLQLYLMPAAMTTE